ncbi:hypothetical protein ABT330_26900 [Streptomyces sp. NPDC000658]|uniref:hypothetical protein n=1 Tax=Streptomyces sp. NPDC000658 TaxID=3154266 RepID=UPI003328E086
MSGAGAGDAGRAVSGEAGGGRKRHRPLRWLLLSTLSCGGAFLTWLWGALAGGLDVAETCTLLRGRRFDGAYRSRHLDESTRWFPLHNKCDATYDLVPAWINPTVVLFSLATAAGLLMTAWTTAAALRACRLRRGGGASDLFTDDRRARGHLDAR